MDQTTSAVGGFVTIDFKDPEKPVVNKVKYDFRQSGYALVIVETGGDHADLTEDYAGVAQEMRSVAEAMGGHVLRDFSRQELLARLPELHGKVSDRALMRAFHFYDDDARVAEQVAALESGQFGRFLELVVEFGAQFVDAIAELLFAAQAAGAGRGFGADADRRPAGQERGVAGAWGRVCRNDPGVCAAGAGVGLR